MKFSPLPILIIFFSLFASLGSVFAQDAVQRSHAGWEHLQHTPYQYTDLNVNGRIVIRGMPEKENSIHWRLLSPSEIQGAVFRHYSTPAGMQVIKGQKALVAGPVAYVASPYIYTDLTGVFLTDPTATQREVGLDPQIHSAHVDFKIDSGLVVIRLEKGIYLIPGPSETSKWLMDHVLSARVGDPYYDEKLKRDQVGYHSLVVPISILEH